jgi:hypothetical protein
MIDRSEPTNRRQRRGAAVAGAAAHRSARRRSTAALGREPSSATAEEFGRFMAAETEKYIVRSAQIKGD